MNKALQTIMGKSNLRFAGMSIAVNISIDGLSLLIPTTRQVWLETSSLVIVFDISVYNIMRYMSFFFEYWLCNE